MFIKKLVTEIAGHKNVDIELRKASGGKKFPRRIEMLEGSTTDKNYYIQIIDCGTDSKVQSDIRENSLSLENLGFEKILGVRDVYPIDRSKLPNLITSVKYTTPPGVKIPVKVIFAVMEVETWFLKEHSHLSKIDPLLVADYIKSQLNYDLELDDLENDVKYSHPAGVLNEIYKLVGRKYDKSKSKVNNLVENLDYEIIYLELIDKLKSISILINELDTFFI